MRKSTKITFVVLAILLVSFSIFRNSKTGIEKSIIKNKVAKVTREPILGKEPVNEFMAKITEGEIPFVDNKQIQHKYDENKTKSSDNLVVKWEEVENPKMEDIKELNADYADFIERYSNARYFKADFTELLKKKVGDKVTLVIDGEEFNGVITNAEIIPPTKSEIEQGFDFTSYDFYIQPIGEDLNDVGDMINIGGVINPKGKFRFEGDIDFTRTNGGIKYRYDINNKIGVIIPYDDFNNYMFNDLGMIFD